MKKRSVIARPGHRKVYLLGVGKDGIPRWLEKSSWDCDWYWSAGYIETYTHPNHPELAADIASHTHFDYQFLNKQDKCAFDAFKDFFAETPFSDKEIWKIVELMQSIYTAKSYSALLYRGGSWQTEIPEEKPLIKCEEEYRRINDIVVPGLLEEL